MTLYPIVKKILINNPDTRDSYKKLLWEVWRELGYLNSGALYFTGLMKRGCPTFESVTRASRYVKERYPELRGNKDVQAYKKRKQSTKGGFALNEQVTNLSNTIKYKVVKGVHPQTGAEIEYLQVI